MLAQSKLLNLELVERLESKNPERIIKHNSGKGSRFAIEQGPFKLAYISKTFPDKSGARKREIQIKGWSREKKLKLISGEWK